MTESDELRPLLEEVLAWLRVQNRDRLRKPLAEVLSTEKDRKAYELTDGSRIAKEVAQTAQLAKSTLSEKWKAWRAIGILVETEDRWKPRHLISIEALGGLPE